MSLQNQMPVQKRQSESEFKQRGAPKRAYQAYKARHTEGFIQQKGVNYNKVLVVKQSTLCAVYSMTAVENLEIGQIEVKAAFMMSLCITISTWGSWSCTNEHEGSASETRFIISFMATFTSEGWEMHCSLSLLLSVLIQRDRSA